MRLSKIELLVFSGAYENWYAYQDTGIHLNDSLTDIEKFYYLHSFKGQSCRDYEIN